MSRWDRIILTALACGLAVFHAHGFFAQRIAIDGRWFCTFGDDAYISMRYAQHLVDGHGLVWNVGEPPVEGFTNLLWTLWIALLTLVSRDPSSLIYASSALFHVGAVILLYAFLRRSFSAPLWIAATAALLLATWQPVLTQVRVGLEAPMLLLLFVAAMTLLFREPSSPRCTTAGAVLAGLLPLVRPDGAFLTAVLGAGLGLAWIRDLAQGRADWKAWARVTALFVGPFIALSLFRWTYFGDVLPNTYYLKVDGRPGRFDFGLRYVSDFLRDFYGSVLLLPVALSALVCGRSPIRALALGMAGLFLYIAWQGGDAWTWWRFMIPLLPMLLVAMGSLTETMSAKRLGRILCGAAWVFICFAGVRDLHARHQSGALWPVVDPSTVANIRLGLALREAAAPGAVTADFWAGAAPYYSGLASIDMLGKSDSHIARVAPYKAGAVPGHDKFDFDYVLARAPDIIISNHRAGASADELAQNRASEFGFGPRLLEHPRLHAEYRPIDSVLSWDFHGIFVRKDRPVIDEVKMLRAECNLLNMVCYPAYVTWCEEERMGTNWHRWTGKIGRIDLLVGDVTNAVMRGEIVSFKVPNDVTFRAGEAPELTWTIEQDGYVPLGPITLTLTTGVNHLEFISGNDGISTPHDSRELAIAVRNVTFLSK